MLNEVKHLSGEREIRTACERYLVCGAQILRFAQDDKSMTATGG